MKKLILLCAMTLSSLAVHARPIDGIEYKKLDGVTYMFVSGEQALKGHGINQYDDSDEPAQGFVVTLPHGYSLANVDVIGNGSSICGVTKYDYRTQTFQIDALSLETDETGCEIILTIHQKNGGDKKVVYGIEQVGT